MLTKVRKILSVFGHKPKEGHCVVCLSLGNVAYKGRDMSVFLSLGTRLMRVILSSVFGHMAHEGWDVVFVSGFLTVFYFIDFVVCLWARGVLRLIYT